MSAFCTSSRLNQATDCVAGLSCSAAAGCAEEDIVLPLLQRYLNIEDRKAAEDLHAFHVPVFRKVPSPLLPGLPQLREFLVQTFPYAMSLREPDMADASLIDDLVRSGFIDQLYAA
jgi:hypothetical protein